MFNQILNIVIAFMFLGLMFIPRALFFDNSGWKRKTRVLMAVIPLLIIMIVAIIYVVIENYK
jgi:4-amino-4-deoxy-L-arabinose transferase-like glycosyltransferase